MRNLILILLMLWPSVLRAQLVATQEQLNTNIRSIHWKFDNTYGAEWIPGDPQYYPAGGGVNGVWFIEDFKAEIDPALIVTNNITVHEDRQENTVTASNQVLFPLTTSTNNFLRVTLSNVAWGKYGISFVARTDASVSSTADQPIRVITMRVNDGPNGETNYYSAHHYTDRAASRNGYYTFDQFQGFSNVTMVADFWMHPASEGGLDIWQVEVHDMLAGAPRDTLNKTSFTTYTQLEWDDAKAYNDYLAGTSNAHPDHYLRPWWEWRANNRPVVTTTTWDSASRTNRDSSIWNHWWPQNFPTGSLYGGNNGTRVPARSGEQIRVQQSTGQTTNWDDAYRIYDDSIATSYSIAQILADPNLTFDGEYYWGIKDGSTWYNTISREHSDVWDDDIFSGEFGEYTSNLGWRYWYTRNDQVGFDGLLAYAGFARLFPSLFAEANDSAHQRYAGALYSNLTGGSYGRFPSEAAKLGFVHYDAWSAEDAYNLLVALDHLWPYLDIGPHRQYLADALTRFMPWIGNDIENVKLFLQNYMIHPIAAATESNRARMEQTPFIGLVAGSGPLAEQYLAPRTTSYYNYYGQPQTQGLTYHQGGSVDRHDTWGEGSSAYIYHGLTYENAQTFKKAAQSGYVAPEDWSDPTIPGFGKSRGYLRLIANSVLGGRYQFDHGDGSQRPDAGPRLEVLGTTSDIKNYMLFDTNSPYAPVFARHLVNELGLTLTGEIGNVANALAAQADRGMWKPAGTRTIEDYQIVAEINPRSNDRETQGAVAMMIGTGAGHRHLDHLSLGFISHGFKAGWWNGLRGEVNNYPKGYTPMMQNVVGFEQWRHERSAEDGWPGHEQFSEGNDSVVSYMPWLSTNAVVDSFSARTAFRSVLDHIDFHQRDTHVFKVDEQAGEYFVAGVQRARGHKFAMWGHNGPWVSGETNGFTVNIAGSLTNNGPITSDLGTISYQYTLRKFARNPSAWRPRFVEGGTNVFQASWRISRGEPESAEVTTITNGDGNGSMSLFNSANVEANQRDAYNAADPRFWGRAWLFDREADVQGTAWAIAGDFDVLEPRVYSMNQMATNSFTETPARDEKWLELYDFHFEGDEVVTAAESIDVGGGTNSLSPAALKVEARANTFFVGMSKDADLTEYTADDLTWQGQVGWVRTNASGFHSLGLVRGTQVTWGGYTLAPAAPLLSAIIEAVDYQTATMTVSPWPGVLKTGPFRIQYGVNGWDEGEVETTWYITNMVDSTQWQWEGEALCGRRPFTSLTSNSVTVQDRGRMAYSHRDTRQYAAMTSESFGKTWLVSNQSSTTMNVVGGASHADTVVEAGDFTDATGDGYTDVYLYRFGPDMTISTPSQVTLERFGDDYRLTSNCAVTVTVPSGADDVVSIETAPDEFTAIASSYDNGLRTFTVPVNLLTGEPQTLQAGDAPEPPPAAPGFRRSGGVETGTGYGL